MSYIQPKTDFKDGDVLYGIDLNASNEVIKAGVDDNFDRIQGLEAGKQDTLTAGTGIEITEDNVINNTQTSAEWGNIQGDITDQTDLVNALGTKQDVIDSSHKLDYGLLSNTPTIPSKTSDLTNDNNTVIDASYVHTDNNYSYTDKGKLAGIESGAEENIIETVKVDGTALTPDANKAVNIDLSGKIDEPTTEGTNGQVLTTDGNGGRTWTTVQGGGGTGDYTDLTNKPQINNVTLSGNKSLSDLGIDIPTKTSDLTNDSNFVDNTDYATNSTGGVFKTGNSLSLSNQGTVYANTLNYEDYQIVGNERFIGKGTLENVISGKNLVSDSSYVHTDNNYTTAEKTKLAGIEAGAQVNVDEVVVFDESAITSDTKLFIEEGDFAPNIVAVESLPIGTVLQYPTVDASKLPTGYMFCDGSAISRTTYADLFSLIGTSFGSGDGSTTFNLPNLKGKVQVGYDSSDTSFDTIGETGGSKTVTLTTQQIPSHSHKMPIGIAQWKSSGGSYGVSGSGTWSFNDNIVTSNTGGGQAHNNLQPYLVTNFIIKVSETSTLIGQVVNSQSDSQIDAYSCDFINDLVEDIYSTTETKTNKIWIDGKPIYRKVHYIASLPNQTSALYDPSISNMNYLVDMRGSIITGAGYMPINTPRPDSAGSGLAFYWESNKIRVISPSDRSSWSAYVILEYTKTS